MAITIRELGESAHNASLRPVVAAIDRELSHLSRGIVTQGENVVPNLLASWAELVSILALGPAPEMRDCPACGRGALRAATLCGFCWTGLPPLPDHRGAQDLTGSLHGA